MTELDRSANARVLAALAYPLGAVGALVCLWLGRQHPFVRFHAWQSILLTGSLVVLAMALRAVPLLGRPLTLVVTGALAGTALYLSARAYHGKWTAMPLLGDVAIGRVSGRRRPRDPEGSGRRTA